MKKRTETLEEKVARVVHEDVDVVPYNSRWPEMFEHDYFLRPSWGDDTPPFYAWFIKRDRNGNGTTEKPNRHTPDALPCAGDA
jgi:hypothetical protein